MYALELNGELLASHFGLSHGARYSSPKIAYNEKFPQYAPGHLIVSEILQECSSRAVQPSSADRMRRLEKEQHKAWTQTSHTRADKPFVRTAGSGDWRTSLSSAAIAEIEEAWGPAMQTLGYTLSRDLPVQETNG